MTPQFKDLARPTLAVVSELSGDEYRDLEGWEILDELGTRGQEIDETGFYNLMFRLRDSNFLSFAAAGGMDARAFGLVRLEDRGRQEVEAWPKPGQVSDEHAQALIDAIRMMAEDSSTPDEQRSRLKELSEDLTVNTAGGILANLARLLGLG